jgi:hypothetical protein
MENIYMDSCLRRNDKPKLPDSSELESGSFFALTTKIQEISDSLRTNPIFLFMRR